jgi:hypothetical protein
MSEECCSISFGDSLKDTFSRLKEDRSLAPGEVANERLGVCLSCEELGALDRCRVCGCFVRAKTVLNNMECPLGKW